MRLISGDRGAAPAHARLRGGARPRRAAVGIVPESARSDRRLLRADRLDLGRWHMPPRGRQCRHPTGQGADRRGGRDRCASRALCALGRHQPGRHRYRDVWSCAQVDALTPLSPRRRAAFARSGGPRPRRRVRAHLDAARAAGDVRAQVRRCAAALDRWRPAGDASTARHALQFGGAAGTLASLGPHGSRCHRRAAALLEFPLPGAPWHTDRERLTRRRRLGVWPAPGQVRPRPIPADADRGRRSFRARRAPATAAVDHAAQAQSRRRPDALSAAAVAPRLVATILPAEVQEHERGLGGWQAEWPAFSAAPLCRQARSSQSRRTSRKESRSCLSACGTI